MLSSSFSGPPGSSREKVISEIGRVLSPGGHTMHRVDLRDHQDFSKPLEFLKPDVPARGCNLWRASQFERAFHADPFHVREFGIFDSCEVKAGERALFRPPFCNETLEELGKLRFLVYATIGNHSEHLEGLSGTIGLP